MRDPFARLKLNRATPQLPAHAMKTYGIQAPLSTHWRVATCQDADCANYRHGWRIHIERIAKRANGELLLRDIKQSGKRFRTVDLGPGQTFWEFEAGQTCFDGDAGRHRVRIGRPELFIVRGGDWRGNPRGEQRTHQSMADWIDDMSEHRDKLLTRLAQG
ncbi:hypothetical protein UK23_29505 [Lentzea aerocolonigenes]|uniref:Uncharacterized protein n=1 Tax=Lentzea aerocolonigenes TaxID=68170 RepID=A0A0F0GSR8_LENAE|nr:hypothetical protein [Lentzea aerocolonigenes]KJK44438.1 hypothetical protein UK23_29505 [Lentzea aerocolonigenes]